MTTTTIPNFTARETNGGVIPLEADIKVPAFPIGALPGWVARHVQAVADDMQVALDVPAIMAVGAALVLTGLGAEVVISSRWREPLNLYLLAAVDSGERKSPTMKAMMGPVVDLEAEAQALAAPIVREAQQRQRLLKARLAEAESAYAKTGSPGPRTRRPRWPRSWTSWRCRWSHGG